MNRHLTQGFEAHPSSEKSRSESLLRHTTVQRICGQAFVWFGVVILGVSLYKFISAFWIEASPLPELQLGAAGLIVVAAGRGFRNSAFIATLLSENSPSARARRSFLMLALASFIMGCVVLLKLSVQDIYRYKRLLGEGGILEYLQALILFTSAWISWLISKDLRKRLFMRLHSVVYAIISFVMLFVGLEEIAWGQILFGWKTPENIAAVNAQNQTTLHNLEFFQNYLDLKSFLGLGRAFDVSAVETFSSMETNNNPRYRSDFQRKLLHTEILLAPLPLRCISVLLCGDRVGNCTCHQY